MEEALAALPRDHLPVMEVHLDGLALLQIVRHCMEGLPSTESGSLLGLGHAGIVEVTHSFGWPSQRGNSGDVVTAGNPKPGSGGSAPTAAAIAAGEAKGEDGKKKAGAGTTSATKDKAVSSLSHEEYRAEMMASLEEVGVDNNCVGWYQSMFLGTFCTTPLVNGQRRDQEVENATDNTVVVLFDPLQAAVGKLVVKAFRLTESYMEFCAAGSNEFIDPYEILEEIPVVISNCGVVSAFLFSLQSTPHTDVLLDTLRATSAPTTVRQMEMMGTWMDELVAENTRFKDFARSSHGPRQDLLRWLERVQQENAERRDADERLIDEDISTSNIKLPETPPRLLALLIARQLDEHCAHFSANTLADMHRLLVAHNVKK